MARKAPTVCLPLPPDIRVLAQRYRGLLCQTHNEASQARCIPINAGTQRRHPPLPRPHQRKSKALYLDQGPKQNHRRCQTRTPSVRFDPLGGHRTRYISSHWPRAMCNSAAAPADRLNISGSLPISTSIRNGTLVAGPVAGLLVVGPTRVMSSRLPILSSPAPELSLVGESL